VLRAENPLAQRVGVAWRDGARSAVRKRVLGAPTQVTVAQAAQVWLEGAATGVIRPRPGDAYKPSAVRAYEAAWRLRIEPVFGRYKLSAVTRNDVQDLVDELVAHGLNEHGRHDAERAAQPLPVCGGAGGGCGQSDGGPRDAGGSRRPRPDRFARRGRSSARRAAGGQPGAVGDRDVRGLRGELMGLQVAEVTSKSRKPRRVPVAGGAA
jgi:hypothetical protein